jgi:hypothetical protein
MTTTTTTMRISTRPPLTAASRQDTRTTPRHTHTHASVCMCVCFLCACACRWSSAPYLIHIGRLSGRLKRIYCSKGSQMYTKCAHPHTHTHIYIYICVCACVCMRACVCAGNKNQDYVIPTTRCSLIYHHIAQDDDDDDREDSACVCIYIYIYMCGAYYRNARTACTHAIIVCVRSGAVDRCV